MGWRGRSSLWTIAVSASSERAGAAARAARAAIANPHELWVLFRMAGWALVLPVLKRLLPLPALARLMWTPPKAHWRDPRRETRIAVLARRLYRSGLVARDDNCLERSLLTYRFLSRLNADPRLVAGVRTGEEGVLGHVWVTLDGEPVGESPIMLGEYAPFAVFGAGGAREP